MDVSSFRLVQRRANLVEKRAYNIGLFRVSGIKVFLLGPHMVHQGIDACIVQRARKLVAIVRYHTDVVDNDVVYQPAAVLELQPVIRLVGSCPSGLRMLVSTCA